MYAMTKKNASSCGKVTAQIGSMVHEREGWLHVREI